MAWVVALIVWIAFIWGNSLTPGDDSSQLSGFFVDLARPVLELLGVRGADAQTFVIRKGAHFTEYLVLAVLASNALLRACGAKGRWRLWTLLLCVAVPCIDETIQLFVPGRVGAVGDVCIDLCGCAVGLALFLIAGGWNSPPRHSDPARR